MKWIRTTEVVKNNLPERLVAVYSENEKASGFRRLIFR